MLTIIQGNDTTVSVLLHSQSLTLPDNEGGSYVERSKIDLSQAKDISVRLIPYMRWRPITPSFEVKGSTISIHYPASVQRPGKWDVEITFLTPDGGGYRQNRVRQAFAEVIACAKGANSPEAYVITADVAQAVQGAKGNPGKSAYEMAQEEEGFVGTKQEYLKSLKGDPGKDIYQLAIEDGYQGSRREYLASQKGEVGKSAYEIAQEEEGFSGTKQEYLKSLKGDPGKDIYQLAVEDGYQGSRREYLASQKGETGDSAYQSYLKTTGDKIKLTEKQWSNSNDFFFQFLFRVLKGAGVKATEEDMTADQVYELDRQRRHIIAALRDHGVDVNDEDGLSIVSTKLAEIHSPVIDIFKEQQLLDWVSDEFPTLRVYRGYAPASLRYMLGRCSRLKRMPMLMEVDEVVDISYMCFSCQSMTSAKVPIMAKVTTAASAFNGCVSLDSLEIGGFPLCKQMNSLVSGCKALKSLSLGDCSNVEVIDQMAAGCVNLTDVTAVFGGSLKSINMSFYGCSSLRKVDATIDLSECGDTGNAFNGCTSLEEVRIKGLTVDLDLSACANLSIDSVRCLVDNAQNVTGKTITLHASLADKYDEDIVTLGDKATEKGWTINYR